MNEDQDKKVYELALLVKTEADLAGVLTLLRGRNAEIVLEPRAKNLLLAYTIKGNTEAVFVSLQFRAYPAEAKELEADLRTENGVIRSLIIASPPPSERVPSAPPSYPSAKRGRPSLARPAPAEFKPAARAAGPLSNEALEKKIEELL